MIFRRPDISSLLLGISTGDKDVVDMLMPVVYAELRTIAGRLIESERSDHTLSPTALIHEAYLKLVGGAEIPVSSRAHFVAVAAKAMRRVLIDYARYHTAEKRGGGEFTVTFDETQHVPAMQPEGLLLLDAALDQLKCQDERRALVIEYWFFGGLTHREIAEVLRVSVPTVRREWRLGRAWLASRLSA